MNVAGLEQFQGEKPEAAEQQSPKKTLRVAAGRHALDDKKKFILMSSARFGDELKDLL